MGSQQRHLLNASTTIQGKVQIASKSYQISKTYPKSKNTTKTYQNIQIISKTALQQKTYKKWAKKIGYFFAMNWNCKIMSKNALIVFFA